MSINMSRKSLNIFATLIILTVLLFNPTQYVSASRASSHLRREVTHKRDIVDFVNILGGTNSQYDLSHGSTLPLIARPWAFNAYAPVTDSSTSWWFHPNDRRFYGLRVTHQPSPWINDYGNFIIKASIPAVDNYNRSDDFSGFDPSASIFKPYYFETALLAYGNMNGFAKFRFANTDHGGIIKIDFPAIDKSIGSDAFLQVRRISVVLNGGDDESEISSTLIPGVVTISGKSTANSGGVASNFGQYFVLALYHGEEDHEVPISSYVDSFAGNSNARLDFSPHDPLNDKITIRFATSLISIAQAVVNLQSEVGTETSFENILKDAKEEWVEVLSRASIDDVGSEYNVIEQENLLTTFYSCLYRASLFPRRLSEYNSTGHEVHWSPYDGLVYEGPLSADSGFWDAFHTVYPLHTLLNVNELGVMIQGWLNAYTEGNWLPKWASPGYRGSMVGTMGDVSLADAIVKNIPGFNRTLAYEAIRKDAFIVPSSDESGLGRECLESYVRHGYISVTAGCDQLVSRTLNYYQSDYAISQAANELEYYEDSRILYQRSQNYPLLFDPKTKFFRSRKVDIIDNKDVKTVTNDFNPVFDQFAWGGEYTEGGPWQYKFYIPYDPTGLANLYQDTLGVNLCDELKTAMTLPSIFHIGSYVTEIHEQTELPLNCWGQYAHNNQPVHYMLYMFGAIDPEGYSGSCASSGQFYIRQALSQLYRHDVNMFSGDEDNGEMAAWFVLSSLGLYSLSPGSKVYQLGSPLFSKVTLSLSEDSSRKLVIEAKNNGPDKMYVAEVYWNGELLSETSSIAYDKIIQGGILTFVMSDKPHQSRH